MVSIPYKSYAFQATKITVFCVLVTYFCRLMGASNQVLLVSFYMAVLTALGTFSVTQKQLSHVILGGVVIGGSLLVGAVLDFYYPIPAKLLAILYSGLAFYLPTKQYQANIYITGSITFLIFSILPFTFADAITYAPYCLGVFVIFILFHLLFDSIGSRNLKDQIIRKLEVHRNHSTAVIAVSALFFSWLIGFYLSSYHHVPQIYWIELTALVVVAGARPSQNAIQTSIKRMIASTMAAVIIIFLFNNILPMIFWLNIAILTVLLFFIFFLQFNYLWKVLFTELFFLAITYLLGDHKERVIFARVILTAIGGLIVIITTWIVDYVFRRLRRCHKG
ncbi:MAG: FUSC family protein [Chlamydiia bacterium]